MQKNRPEVSMSCGLFNHRVIKVISQSSAEGNAKIRYEKVSRSRGLLNHIVIRVISKSSKEKYSEFFQLESVIMFIYLIVD